MRLAIMQPYFLPYIGYFQLIGAADVFVLYDNIKYTKKGWINRNRYLQNGHDALFTLPLKKDSDALDIVGRELAEDFDPKKLLNQFHGSYYRAPHFAHTFQLLEAILCHQHRNLFHFIQNSLRLVCTHLALETQIVISSEVEVDHQLKNQDRVIAVCTALGADCYINAIGGMQLYTKGDFEVHGLSLKFLQSKPIEYAQFGASFIPWLSIVDLLMFLPLEVVQEKISNHYELI